MRYGLVFKYEDFLWLATYLDEGIATPDQISDDEQIYKDLGPSQVSVVEVESYQQDVIKLKDLFKITVEHEFGKGLSDLLKEGGFPTLAKELRKQLPK